MTISDLTTLNVDAFYMSQHTTNNNNNNSVQFIKRLFYSSKVLNSEISMHFALKSTNYIYTFKVQLCKRMLSTQSNLICISYKFLLHWWKGMVSFGVIIMYVFCAMGIPEQKNTQYIFHNCNVWSTLFFTMGSIGSSIIRRWTFSRRL